MKKGLKELFIDENQKKILAVFVTIAMIIILIPLFWISHYNFMSVDDYEYGLQSGAVWKETRSVLQVFIAQIAYAWDYYFEWQGTFFSEWLSTSLIGIFAEEAYFMGTYISLGGFVLAEYFLLMIAFRKILQADKYLSRIVALTCIAVQVLTVPSPCEAFFWFCSAILYTFCLAIAFCLITLWILFYFDNGKKRWKTRLLSTGIPILTVAVGGGNYIIGLVILLLYLACIAWFVYRKHSGRVYALAMGMLYLLVFCINVFAPGNSNRQDAVGHESLSAITSILMSLKEAAVYITENISFLSVVLAVLFFPVFVKMVKGKQYKWRFPLLVTLISFGIYAALFTPHIYAIGNLGPGRVQNLYGMTFWLWLYGNELYWVGWATRRLSEKGKIKNEEPKSYLLAIWTIGSIFLVIGLFLWDGKAISSNSALQSLRSGEAQTYYQEHQERLAILQNPEIKEAYVKPYTVLPYVLYFWDISYDIHDWANETVATYYGKDIVGYKE